MRAVVNEASAPRVVKTVGLKPLICLVINDVADLLGLAEDSGLNGRDQ
jgi:hypothetical protein